MSELLKVGQYVALAAEDLIPALIKDDNLPDIVTRRSAEAAIDAVVKQDPTGKSKRVWSAVFAVATAVLAVPEIQAYLGPWVPVITALLSATFAAVSKREDPRPARD
jgi:hypothetical protein